MSTQNQPAERGIDRLTKWYASKCNGDWEHMNGVHIENTDNPGWLVRIEEVDIPTGKGVIDNCEWDVTDFVLTGYSDGPNGLDELLGILADLLTQPTLPAPV